MLAKKDRTQTLDRGNSQIVFFFYQYITGMFVLWLSNRYVSLVLICGEERG